MICHIKLPCSHSARMDISLSPLPLDFLTNYWLYRYYALGGSITVALISGYTVFLPGKWSLPDFLFTYTILAVLPILFLYYKFRYRTKVIRLLKPPAVESNAH